LRDSSWMPRPARLSPGCAVVAFMPAPRLAGCAPPPFSQIRAPGLDEAERPCRTVIATTTGVRREFRKAFGSAIGGDADR
jgi:hypothetical protein